MVSSCLADGLVDIVCAVSLGLDCRLALDDFRGDRAVEVVWVRSIGDLDRKRRMACEVDAELLSLGLAARLGSGSPDPRGDLARLGRSAAAGAAGEVSARLLPMFDILCDTVQGMSQLETGSSGTDHVERRLRRLERTVGGVQ